MVRERFRNQRKNNNEGTAPNVTRPHTEMRKVHNSLSYILRQRSSVLKGPAELIHSNSSVICEYLYYSQYIYGLYQGQLGSYCLHPTHSSSTLTPTNPHNQYFEP